MNFDCFIFKILNSNLDYSSTVIINRNKVCCFKIVYINFHSLNFTHFDFKHNLYFIQLFANHT